MISEELLHYIWRTRRFDHKELKTESGETVQILDYGVLNTSDGPDFLGAKIKIGNIEWNGAVEMHVRSSDWKRHKHMDDPNYKKTILHVVHENDVDIAYESMEKIPTVTLKNRLSENLVKTYKAFDTEYWIPCQQLIGGVSTISAMSAKEKALVQRMQDKVKQVLSQNLETQNDLEEVIYRLVLRAFGLIQNSESFLDIAKGLPLKVLKKNRHNTRAIEAMLYGMAGMLQENYKDEYPRALKSEFLFLQKKYGLNAPELSIVKRKGVRPNSFPEIRLSIFAHCITRPNFFTELLKGNIDETSELLGKEASEYWLDHYTFDKKAKTRKVKKLGLSSLRVIIINAVVPALLFIGQRNQEEAILQRAYNILEHLPGEKNAIISKWRDLGINTDHAFDSQALIGLKKDFCDHKKCLHCPIGHDLLKNS